MSVQQPMRSEPASKGKARQRSSCQSVKPEKAQSITSGEENFGTRIARRALRRKFNVANGDNLRRFLSGEISYFGFMKKGHQPLEAVTIGTIKKPIDARNGNIINQKCFNRIDEPKYMAAHWLRRSSKILFLVAIAVLIVLNLYTFVIAYPETSRLDSGISGSGVLAKDFSAYYIGAWRLLHDPSQVYTHGYVNDGEYQVYPQPEAYKYLPSFLVMVSPLLFLGYQQALVAFDVFQFALLPLMALLLYKLLSRKGLVLTFAVAVIVLLQPLPLPNWGLSATYFWQWGEGQAKVFDTFLLLLAFYLGDSGRPLLSGIVFALAVFDPRFAVLSLPLFLFYNKKNLRVSVESMLGALLLSNFVLLYPGTGSGFLNMALGSATETLYYYAFIPLLMIISLTVVNGREMVATLSRSVSAYSPKTWKVDRLQTG